MKFVLVVLMIHFVVELIGNRKKRIDIDIEEDDEVETNRHPAEYEVR